MDINTFTQIPFLITLFLAFIEGFALIISPCILPLLPVLLAGSLLGSKKYPLGIIVGFILSFALFSLFAKKILQILGIDLEIIRTISFSILILIGIIMLSDYLSMKFSNIFHRIVDPAMEKSTAQFDPEKGFFQGLLFGGLLGLVWTPCAGPILAAVLVQTVLANTNLASFFTLLAFAIGVGLPLLLIVYFSRYILEKLGAFKKYGGLIRKILGLLLIIGVILMIYAEQIIFALSKPTEVELKTRSSASVNPSGDSAIPNKDSAVPVRSYPAPPIEDIAFWINTKPVDLKDLKGKVVLIDFWTYSCINCIRTLPYLNHWYQKYHDKGLVILGIHTPEFEFEKKFDNVKTAVQNYGIQYPVLLDNQYSTWRNYRNRYWPATYLINKEGQVVYTHFGEGNYPVTEDKIRELLGLPSSENESKQNESDYNSDLKRDKNNNRAIETPETYLGYERSHNFVSPNALVWFYNKPNNYQYPETMASNDWALKGNWSVFQNSILANEKEAALKIRFNAGKVFAVMGSRTGKPITVHLKYNANDLVSEQGKDVKDSQVTVESYKLYELLDFKTQSGGLLELISEAPGLELFTFTFGS